MTTSVFDPDAFLAGTVVTEANSTEFVPVPVGEYQAVASDVKPVPWSKKDGSASGVKLQIIWEIQDEGVKALLERDKVTCRQDIMLDLNGTGGLETGKGKNVALGRLRAALNLNESGVPFSFPMIVGRMGTVSIKHEPYNDSILAYVAAVAAA